MGLNICLIELLGRDANDFLIMKDRDDLFDSIRECGDKDFVYDNDWEYIGEPGYAGYLQRPKSMDGALGWIATNDCNKERLNGLIKLLETHSNYYLHISH